MLLANLLNPKAILHLDGEYSKEEVYRLLLGHICQKQELPECGEELLTKIMQRDQESSTAYPTGIAIPHIRVEGFQDTIIGMAFLKQPVAYNGSMVNWIALVISNISSTSLYLNLVASLLKISKDAALVQSLINMEDGSAVVQHFKKLEIQIKKEVTIADIMISDPVSITKNAKLSELIDILNNRRISFVPVVDEDNNYLGVVNVLSLLKVGVPDYLMMLDNLSFLRSYEPLEKLLQEQTEISVGEIMKNGVSFLKPDTSIPEAVFEMIHKKMRFFSVVDEAGKLVGVVTAMDILRKVIKA